MAADESGPAGGADFKAQYEAILGAAVDAIIVIDTRGLIRELNPAACALFGYARDELLGRNVRTLMPTAYSVEHDLYIERYLATREPKIIGIGREVTGRRRNGDEFPMDLAVGEIHGAHGISGFVGLIRDISARQAMNEKLRQQEVEHRERLAHAARLGTLGELAAGIAHEVNQPLAAISNYADATRRLILSGDCDSDQILAALEKISAQADRAGQVIERTRHFVRRRDAGHERIDCNAMVSEAWPLADMDARRHRLALDLDLATEPLPVDGDAIQLQQVLLNLVRNAVDAMTEQRQGDSVRISSLRRGQDWIEIRVDDAGPGIADEVLPRLFEPFVSSKPDGLGLGLSICRSIVEAHGGELRHEPRAEGGTRFSMLLPVARD